VRARIWILVAVLCAGLPLRADADTIYLSTASNASLGGLSFRNADIVRYDTVTGTASLFFDEDRFANNEDVDGFSLLPNGHLLLSTKSTATLGGLTFEDGDIVEYDPVANSAVPYFSESKFTTNVNVDGFAVLPNGHLLLSTAGNATLGGLSFRDGDLAEYDRTTGFATLYFSENHFAANEDIDAVSVLPNGSIILSTTNDATLGGVSFHADDLVQWFPATNTASLYFSGSQFAANENIDAVLVVVPEPGSASLCLLGLALFAARRRARRRPAGSF